MGMFVKPSGTFFCHLQTFRKISWPVILALKRSGWFDRKKKTPCFYLFFSFFDFLSHALLLTVENIGWVTLLLHSWLNKTTIYSTGFRSLPALNEIQRSDKQTVHKNMTRKSKSILVLSIKKQCIRFPLEIYVLMLTRCNIMSTMILI